MGSRSRTRHDRQTGLVSQSNASISKKEDRRRMSLTGGSEKHTPGPWLITPNGCHVYGTLKSAPDAINSDLYVCTLAHNKKERANSYLRATGHLIAAAPDLLAALNKAREEILLLVSNFYRNHDRGEELKAAWTKNSPILKQIDAAIKKAEEGQ